MGPPFCSLAHDLSCASISFLQLSFPRLLILLRAKCMGSLEFMGFCF